MGGLPFLVAGKVIVILGCGDISPHAVNPLKYLLNLHKTSHGLIVSVRKVSWHLLDCHHR
jgi:hypothetical protein